MSNSADNSHLKMQPRLTLAGAKAALQAAEQTALRNAWPVCIAVCDAAGSLLAFSRLDGAPIGSIDVVLAKSRTAGIFGMPTKTFQGMIDGGRPSLLNVPGACSAEGGVPIIIDGVIVGAVAASGVSSEDDAAVAQAGVNAISSRRT
jgi:glc operon protein GlcG